MSSATSAASALLSAPSAKAPAIDPSVPRLALAHINQSAPFRIRHPDFERQYSHTYAHRLHAMKQTNPKLHSSTLDSCKGSIEQLAGSNDPDCEFFAKLCLGRVDETGRDI